MYVEGAKEADIGGDMRLSINYASEIQQLQFDEIVTKYLLF
ncbi:hypothetical protein [Bacillus sp. EB106-08-02-XG196]|nr:hypothetical protein [Bacillus sp. EB106-08-02-XG196]